MKTYNATLVLVIKGNRILLALKKYGFGEGKWNGVGGKIEQGETAEQCAVRETQEEIGITPIEYEKVGILEFDEYIKGERGFLVGHVYRVTEFTGEPTESDEMRPEWFDIDKIPYNQMFPDDQYWLPLLLAGKKFKAFFKYDKDWNMLSHKLTVVKII